MSKSSFSANNRNAIRDKMKEENFDLLVIGGGMTGAGIALDAVSRGLKVALVEKHDFASGTSSRSTKLIHGGLRYLKQLEVAVEILEEHKIAPIRLKDKYTPEARMCFIPYNITSGFELRATKCNLRTEESIIESIL